MTAVRAAVGGRVHGWSFGFVAADRGLKTRGPYAARGEWQTRYQSPQWVIAGEDPTSTSSSGGSRSRASMKAVSRAWPSSTTRSPRGPM
jgi:hypothetical protein